MKSCNFPVLMLIKENDSKPELTTNGKFSRSKFGRGDYQNFIVLPNDGSFTSCVTCQSLTISKSVGLNAITKTLLSHSQTEVTYSLMMSMEQLLKSWCANSIWSESKPVYLTSQHLYPGLFFPLYLFCRLYGLKPVLFFFFLLMIIYPIKNVGLLSILSPGRQVIRFSIRSLSAVIGIDLSSKPSTSSTMILELKSRSNLF